jgi:hypothetical protein
MRMLVARVPRNPVLIARLESEAVKFLGEVTATVAALADRYRYPMPERAPPPNRGPSYPDSPSVRLACETTQGL